MRPVFDLGMDRAVHLPLAALCALLLLSSCAGAPATSTATPSFFVSDFAQRQGESDDRWLESGIPQSLLHNWRRRTTPAATPEGADVTLGGEYWIRNGRLIVAARLARGLRTVKEYQWDVEAGRPELLLPFFQQAGKEIETELQKLGVMR